MRGKRSSATCERLIDAAEALIAKRGIAGVTTRDILELAGQRNQSALHYHFGSLEGLVRAALIRELERIDAHRAELLRKSPRGNVPGIMRALILPLAEDCINGKGGRHHLSLLNQYVHTPLYDYEDLINESCLPGICAAMDRLWDAIQSLDSHIGMVRYHTAFTATLTALALWCQDEPRASAAEFTEELIATIHPLFCGSTTAGTSAYWQLLAFAPAIQAT